MLPMSKLEEFLRKNTVHACEDLPVVHTAPAKCLRNFMSSKSLKPTDCTVFNEKLLYLFYGKPSYRVKETTQKEWLMPVCFLIKFDSLQSIKRIFPFDSGAFKANRHPGYMQTFNIENFEVSGQNDPSKIVGALFNTILDYFRLLPKAKDEFVDQHSLTLVKHPEILALRDLAGDTSLIDIDDRRFCVEIQTEDEISLIKKNVQAVVLPYDYFADKSVVNFIENDLEATPLLYHCFSASSSDHTVLIYEKVYNFLQGEGRKNDF